MRSSGFTLLELLVVIAIIGIVASIGTLSYIGYINSTRADAAASEVGRLFDKAKDRVRIKNVAVQMVITPSTNTIVLSQNSVEFSRSTLDATISSVTCRPACPSNIVDVVAPYGNYNKDVKVTLAYANKTRDVYALGPTALLKIVKR